MANKCLGRQRVTGKLGRDPPFAHDDHAVRHTHDLGDFRADHDHRQSLRGQFGHEVVHGRFRADVDALGRLVKDDDLRLGRQPLGDHHLLLVAAGKVAHIGVQRRGAQIEPLGIPRGQA